MFRFSLIAVIALCLTAPLPAAESEAASAAVEPAAQQAVAGFSAAERAVLIAAEHQAVDQGLQEQRAAGITNDSRFWIGAGVAVAVIVVLIIIF